MSQPTVGQEVLSHCNKCALALAHIVLVIKEDGKLGRCQCKTCGAKHVYKDPEAVKKKATRKRRKKAAEVPMVDLWQSALKASEHEPKKYSIKDQFYLGEIIDHPTFGQGVVQKEMDGNKISVIFETDYKTLVHKI